MRPIKENSEHIREKTETKTQIQTLRTDIDTRNRKEQISHYSKLLRIEEEQVENALKALDSAFLRLQANPYFRKQYGDFDPYSALPLMAKESFLDNTRISKTGAVGYFQLKPDAIDDAKKILASFGIQKEYDPKNPVDNCILGLLYFDNTKYRLWKELDTIRVGEEFTYLAYNGWVKRSSTLIEKYQKESWNTRIEWKKFAAWMAGLLEKNPKEEMVRSEEYWVHYTKWLKQDWRKDDTLISLGNDISIKKSKIEEMLNYVEKISALQKKKKEMPHPQDTVSSESKSMKPETSSPIKYQKNYDIFHGDGPIDSTYHAIWKAFWSHEQYMQIQSTPGQWIIQMLERANIQATQEAIDEFRKINHLDTDDAIMVGAYYLLPNRLKQSVSWRIQTKKQDTLIEKERMDRDFYKWLESIEVKNHSLRWKLFILDPWHGWLDPWSIPIIYDETGKPVPFKNSDITSTWKATKNGKWDGFFHIIESKITMDIAYRIAKKIRENGGEVKITHYFQKWIDNSIQNPWNPLYQKQWNLDEQENYDTWGDGEKKVFQDGSTDWLKKRVEIRNNFQSGKKPENTYFISIHADSLPHDKDEWILVMHSQKHEGQKKFAKELASSIGFVRNKWALSGSREKGIYVLDGPWALSQNVLIELGNMNNKNTSYALRLWETREEYAEWIFVWLKKLATRK